MTKNILRIDASMRRNNSYSRQLSDLLVKHLQEKNDQVAVKVAVKTRDLSQPIPFINEDWINANFTEAAQRTAEQRAVLAQSDALISELKMADTLVVGIPIYNFNVPAAFKAWIDQVARVGITFKYGQQGPVGLLEGKKVYIIVTSGGTELGSEIDYASNYLRHVFAFIGITDLTFIDATTIARNEENILQASRAAIAAV